MVQLLFISIIHWDNQGHLLSTWYVTICIRIVSCIFLASTTSLPCVALIDYCTRDGEGVSCSFMNISGTLTRSCCGINRLPPAKNPLCGQCRPGYSEWGGSCVGMLSYRAG
jgi:hypothetical protein